jgi:hypothetical protein
MKHYEIAAHVATYNAAHAGHPLSLTQRVAKLTACVKAARRSLDHALTTAEAERAQATLATLRQQWAEIKAELDAQVAE